MTKRIWKTGKKQTAYAKKGKQAAGNKLRSLEERIEMVVKRAESNGAIGNGGPENDVVRFHRPYRWRGHRL